MPTIYDLNQHPAVAALIAALTAQDSAAVAYSGGTDSTFLLKAAHDLLGERCLALSAVSPAFPDEGDAFCAREGIRRVTLAVDVLNLPAFRDNPPERCYHCKRYLFERMRSAAAEQGIGCLMEGSNLDDEQDYRPGLRALTELGILSPLRDCGFTKAEIRQFSRALDLPTWDRPAAACLASRIPYGEGITAEKLHRIRAGEELLRTLGFRQCRVRLHGNLARIEVPLAELPMLTARRETVAASLRAMGFSYVTLDLEGFRSGSLNEVLARKGESDGTA